MVQHILSIAGFSDIIGAVSVTLSVVVVGIVLQRMKGPSDQSFNN
jgi:hypothetical protein